MNKSLIAAALILCTSQFALAQEVFYVIKDNTTNECRAVDATELAATQKGRFTQLGRYATMDEAKAAIASMPGKCPK